MRPRKKDRHLPPCVHPKHGAFYYVKKNKWTFLGKTLPEALREYSRIVAPTEGGCDELLDRTLADCQKKVDAGKLAPNTILQYRSACKQLKLNLSEFTPADVKPKDIAGILYHDRDKPNMANRKLTFLRLAFGNGLTWGMCEINPTFGVSRLEEAKRDRLITPEEFRAVQAKAPIHLQLIMELAFLTGQRIMDVVKIKLSDISPEGIYFRQQKTGKQILVVMTQDIRNALERARALHDNVRGLTLFHQRGGRQYGYGATRRAFEKACKEAGVENYRLNDNRAMSLTAADLEGKNAQKLAGHTSRATTEGYIRHRQVQVVEGPSIRLSIDREGSNPKKSSG